MSRVNSKETQEGIINEKREQTHNPKERAVGEEMEVCAEGKRRQRLWHMA